MRCCRSEVGRAGSCAEGAAARSATATTKAPQTPPIAHDSLASTDSKSILTPQKKLLAAAAKKKTGPANGSQPAAEIEKADGDLRRGGGGGLAGAPSEDSSHEHDAQWQGRGADTAQTYDDSAQTYYDETEGHGGSDDNHAQQAQQGLPAGWAAATSRSTGETYYVHIESGESTFNYYDLPNGQGCDSHMAHTVTAVD